MRILIVLEGERTEPDFFQSILQRFELNAELCVVGTNLYTLYHKCKEYFFDCDIKDVLLPKMSCFASTTTPTPSWATAV